MRVIRGLTSKKENTCENCIGHEHCEKRLHNRRGGGLTDAFRATFDMQSRIAGNRDDDPGKSDALDNSRIQVPGVGALECTQDVTGGIEIKREPANRPTSYHA